MALMISQYNDMAIAIDDLIRSETLDPNFHIETFVDANTDSICYAKVTFFDDKDKEHTFVKKIDFFTILDKLPPGAEPIGNGAPGRNANSVRA